ncbi:pro-resilin-like [Hermetia illucens]|nr:pro-resilin-like [Hermetia illucens]
MIVEESYLLTSLELHKYRQIFLAIIIRSTTRLLLTISAILKHSAKMKAFVIALLATAVAADVSHLTGPKKEYLPPFQGGAQGGPLGPSRGPSREYLAPHQGHGGASHSGSGQFGGHGHAGAGQFGGHGAGAGAGSQSFGHQRPSNQYLAPQAGGQFGGSGSGHFGGASGAGQFGGSAGSFGQKPSNQYLAPHQGKFGGSQQSHFGGQHSSQFGGAGGASRPSNQYLAPFAGQGSGAFGDASPAHSFGADGYKYKSPNF